MNSNFQPSQGQETCALIIGSGISGLFTARVLSEYYDQVLLIERDHLPEVPAYRAGTPQSFHFHRMVGRGREIVEHLFPGILSELLEHGAVSTPPRLVRLESQYCHFEMHSPVEEASCSRYLLEWTLRRRVQAIPNIRFLTALNAVGLQMDPEHTRITGVHVQSRIQSEQLSTLTADLIVDASGLFSNITPWLRDLGYDVPEPERIHTALEYSSRHYQVTPQLAKERVGILINGEPEKKMGTIYAFVVENNQWLVILYGAGGNYPPTDVNGFDQYLRKLPRSILANTLQAEAIPTTSPRGFRIAECRRQHFDQMANWPTGLLVVGDALCNLDPIYGHGMTVSALEAEILRNCLSEQKKNPQPGFERRVLTALQDAIEPAWWIDGIADLRWPGVTYTGQQPPKAAALVQRYLDLYYEEATKRMLKQIAHTTDDKPIPPAQPNVFSPEPSMVSYLMVMFDLLLSPSVLFNATTYRLLLEIEATQEGPHVLQNLTDEYKLPLEEILNEFLPAFSLPFMSPPIEAAAD